jgi:hypothetical protein
MYMGAAYLWGVGGWVGGQGRVRGGNRGQGGKAGIRVHGGLLLAGLCMGKPTHYPAKLLLGVLEDMLRMFYIADGVTPRLSRPLIHLLQHMLRTRHACSMAGSCTRALQGCMEALLDAVQL